MKKELLILTAASLLAVGGCKSKEAENVANAPAEANVTENYPGEMNATTPTENNAAAEMNLTTGNAVAGNKAATVANNVM